MRGARSRPVSSVEANTEGADEGPDDTDGHTGAARPAPLSVLRKYGSKASKATAAEEGEGEAMDLDADSVAASAAVPSEEQVRAVHGRDPRSQPFSIGCTAYYCHCFARISPSIRCYLTQYSTG